MKITLLCFLFAFNLFATDFTDQELDDLLKGSSVGLIYIWSPMMPLSELGREEIIKVSNELGIDSKILIDNNIYFDDYEDDVLHSKELISFNVQNHFPSIVLYKNGKLIENVIYGYELDQEYLKEMILDLLDQENDND